MAKIVSYVKRRRSDKSSNQASGSPILRLLFGHKLVSWGCLAVVLLISAALWAQTAPNEGEAAPESQEAEAVDIEFDAAADDLFKRFTELSELSEEDPCSEKVKEAQAALDAAMKRMEEVSERMPQIPPEVLKAQQEAAAPKASQADTPAIEGPTKPVSPQPEQRPADTSEAPAAMPEPVPSRVERVEPAGPAVPDVPRALQDMADRVNAPTTSRVQAVDAEQAEAPQTPVVEDDVEPSPDDIVQMNIKDDILDLDMLIDTVGKELGFNILFDSPQGHKAQVKFLKFGDIRRRDLLPLLESILSFQNLTMVREDPFIRIVPRQQATQKTITPLGYGKDLEETMPGDQVMTQIIELEYANSGDVRTVLGVFTDINTIVDVPNTGYIILTDYASRMPRLVEMIDLIDQPGPSKRLEVIELTFVEADEVKTQLDSLLQDLAEEGVGVSAPTAQPQTPQPPRRPSRTRTPQPQTPEQAASQTGGPIIHTDERTNRLLIIGTDEQISLAQDLLVLLDVEQPSTGVRLLPLQVTHVFADEIVEQLADLIDALMSDRRTDGQYDVTDPTPNQPQPRTPVRRPSTTQNRSGYDMEQRENVPFMLADERTNRILAVGSEEQLLLLQELLGVLDIPPYEVEPVEIRVYEPQFVEAAEAERILDALQITRSDQQRPRDRARQSNSSRSAMQGPEISRPQPMLAGQETESGLLGGEQFEVRLAVQESTNKMFVMATKAQHDVINEVMIHIDSEPNDRMGAIRIYQLENREPEVVTTMLQDLLESDTYDEEKNVKIPGKEGAPKVVALDEIYAVAVRASSRQHAEIEEILRVLDKRLPQVLVEAMLVQVSADDALDVGVSLKDYEGVGSGKTVSGVSPFGFNIAQAEGSSIVTGTGGTFAFFDDDLVYATLEVLQSEGGATITSKPRILVNDNEEGAITSERQEPTTRTTIPAGSDTPIIEFKGYESAGTTLTITPHISDGNFLQLEINLNVNAFDGEGTETVPPPKTTNDISTIVTVPDGKTIVLGGLTTTNEGVTVNKIPLLGDIPIVGAAFRQVSKSQNKVVLYVFVKVNIVRDEFFADLDEISEYHKNKVRELEKRDFQSIIPGIPDRKKDKPSVLDDD